MLTLRLDLEELYQRVKIFLNCVKPAHTHLLMIVSMNYGQMLTFHGITFNTAVMNVLASEYTVLCNALH